MTISYLTFFGVASVHLILSRKLLSLKSVRCEYLTSTILIMVNYSNAEMAEMHFVYGVADGNAELARRIYHERYPNRDLPDSRTFSNVHRRLVETGSVRKGTSEGRPQNVRTPEIEEAVLHEVEEHPETSTRKIARNLNICHQIVWRILVDYLLYPYHILRVQALLPRDFLKRLTFCQWYLHNVELNPQFERQILFTDEANFSRNAIQNFHNNHLWADENPHAIKETHFQHQFSVNVWAGIIGDNYIGPFFLPGRLDGQSYYNFLRDQLPLLLEDVPLAIRNQMWYMHDGAPAHFSVMVRNYLQTVFPNRCIGRGGNVQWPPRSPDLNSLDFFLWGHLKTLVYTSPINTVEELRERIVAACDGIQNTPRIFERVRNSMRRRAEACRLSEGGHFQQFL